MLDRFPTELITLIVDAASSDAWVRKAVIDNPEPRLHELPDRHASAPGEHRPHPEGRRHPAPRSWPSTRRKAVVTLFVGPHERFIPPDRFEFLQAFNLQDFSPLLTILPNVKFIHLPRVADSYAIDEDVGLCSQPMCFELTSSNPFRRMSIALGLRKKSLCMLMTLPKTECLSLSLLQSLWCFPHTVEFPRFKLRRLRLDFVSKGAADDAFVNSDFLDFMDSRETLS